MNENSMQVIVLGSDIPNLPDMFIQVGLARNIISPNNPATSVKLFQDILAECLETNTALLLQDVPAMLVDALVRLSDRREVPQIYITVSKNISPDVEAPNVQMVAIYHLISKALVWSLADWLKSTYLVRARTIYLKGSGLVSLD